MTEFDNSPSDEAREDAQAEAVDNAVIFTTEQITGAADRDITPQEAAQMGMDYVGFTHQSASQGMRFADQLAPGTRTADNDLGKMYRKDAEVLRTTGAIIESLKTEPDITGIRNYLMGAAKDYKEIADKVRDEELLNTSRGFEKVAGLIPDEGFEAKAPMIAWMDPRFNGEADMLPPTQ